MQRPHIHINNGTKNVNPDGNAGRLRAGGNERLLPNRLMSDKLPLPPRVFQAVHLENQLGPSSALKISPADPPFKTGPLD